MFEAAHSTLDRRVKGAIAPPPQLGGGLQAVVEAVAAWTKVEATAHWHLCDPGRVDGVDFYVGPYELGHLHLDGTIHLATSPRLGAALVAEGLGQPFRWVLGWTEARVHLLGMDNAVAIFHRNYDRLCATACVRPKA